MISATLEISGKPIKADLLNVEEYIDDYSFPHYKHTIGVSMGSTSVNITYIGSVIDFRNGKMLTTEEELKNFVQGFYS